MKTQFPETFSALSLEELQTLLTEGLAEFDSLYSTDFATLDDKTVDTLTSLTDGLQGVKDELATREARTASLAAMGAKKEEFAKVSGTFEAELDEEAPAAEDEEEEEAPMTAASDRDPAALAVAPTVDDETPPQVAYATGEGLGVSIDAPLDWAGVGKALDKRLSGYNVTPYQNAAASKRTLRQVQSFAAFGNNVPEAQMIRADSSRGAVRRAIDASRDQTKLEGGSLIASGGWGAPSPIDYTPFRKLSCRDGLASFPTIGVEHGGLQITRGTNFSDVYASNDFIAFDEQQDEDGEYEIGSGENTVGSKPVYRITPAEWIDYRLQVDGIHIQAGILESRGYPEGISSEVAQVLDAHAHKLNGKAISAVAAGSDEITMTAGQLGTAAPVLTAVELQVLHYRDTHRMCFDETLEAKFPVWIKGAFRADLARRMGVDLLDVSDSRIDQWFALRGVSLEYVYDWQTVASTAKASFKAFPTTVSFLLYAAGTWVKGVSEVISLDTMYDSTLLGTNDYTVLFTEEGWFVAKAGHDSRLITTSISSTGVTNIGDEIANSGAAI